MEKENRNPCGSPERFTPGGEKEREREREREREFLILLANCSARLACLLLTMVGTAVGFRNKSTLFDSVQLR